MIFKQTSCVSIHLISKFIIFFSARRAHRQKPGPRRAEPARAGPCGLFVARAHSARLARRSTGPQAITKNKNEFC